MKLRSELERKGYVSQTTCPSIFERLEKGGVSFYVGFDCTAPSLHAGHLLPLMVARTLQKYGNRPLILLGGATSGIGDPSGKSESRNFLSSQEIQFNRLGIEKSLKKFIDFNSGALLFNNADWMNKISCLDYLREFARHFSVNQMLAAEFVKGRIKNNSHISLMEFNYIVLQGLDFLHLRRECGCSLQIGGSDQWGNIVAGIDLVRRVTGDEVFGFTTPLLTTASGRKMGKSDSGAIWLNSDLLPPYHYFQYWRNIRDEDIEKVANAFCEWEPEEVEEICELKPSTAKEKIAFRLTSLCHGDEDAVKSRIGSKLAFSKDIQNLSDDIGSLPRVHLDSLELSNGADLALMLFRAKLASSRSEAKRLIVAGSVKVNGTQVLDSRRLSSQDVNSAGYIKLSVGKKKHALLVVQLDM